MTKEDKQLLLQDLCARLPYGVKCQFEDTIRVTDGESSPFYDYVLSAHHLDIFIRHNNFYIKPYLRPISSMTKEEKEELRNTYSFLYSDYPFDDENEDEDEDGIKGHYEPSPETYDWYKRKMFDYRGLIPKGLAISTETFNPYKKD